MKKLALVLCLALAVPVLQTGCSTPPSERVVAVQTLKAVGHSAEASVQLAGQLYSAGKITSGQLLAVANFYDGTFQPAFRLAVATVNANLTVAAPQDLIALSVQLANLVASFQKS